MFGTNCIPFIALDVVICSKFADGQNTEFMEVLLRGELEVERLMGDPVRKYTALLTKARL